MEQTIIIIVVFVVSKEDSSKSFRKNKLIKFI